MNNVNLIGRITKDFELRVIPQSNTATTNFILAVDKGMSRDKKAEMEAKGQPTADFIRVSVFGKQAESVCKYSGKGKLIGIAGRIQTGSYDDKDGRKVFTTDVVASSIDFLEWGEKTEIPEGFSPSDEAVPW
jgi:single-strand DNA-binding protein